MLLPLPELGTDATPDSITVSTRVTLAQSAAKSFGGVGLLFGLFGLLYLARQDFAIGFQLAPCLGRDNATLQQCHYRRVSFSKII